MPCKVFIYSLSQELITLHVNFNKAATSTDRVLTTNQRKLIISNIYESNVYSHDSIRFRVEADAPLELAIKAEFEPIRLGRRAL